MGDLVRNPEDRFCRDAAHISNFVRILHQEQTLLAELLKAVDISWKPFKI